jgi:RNA:NAD 2'-phosphotransferase (TPT1/KptA family)
MEEIKKLAQVHKILDFHVKKNPDNVSLSIDSTSYTNSDILLKVLSFVGLFKKNKVTAGDRIAFLAKFF